MAKYDNDTVDFECELKDETDGAFIVSIEGEDVSIPKSISQWHPQRNKIDGVIEIPTWFARKKGLA